MQIILFETKKRSALYPITLTRPSFAILCGGTTLYRVIKKQFVASAIDYVIPEYLSAITAREYPRLSKKDNQVLLLDASLVPSFALVVHLAQKIKTAKKSFILKNKTQIIGAWLDLSEFKLTLATIRQLQAEAIEEFLKSLKVSSESIDWPQLLRPWEVIAQNQPLLTANSKYLAAGLRKYRPNVFCGSRVTVEANVTFDTSQGSIVISDGTLIKSGAVLRGPLFIGKNCIINSFAELKDGCSIGDVNKVGGEVEEAIIQGYSNKQHHGFLGHSYVGQWVNLGAGTTNSDLKSTYGSVKMAGIDTGRQFLGCVVGDYAKAAVNTAIFTGKVIGVSSFLFGYVTDDVPSFTNFVFNPKSLVECPLATAHKIQASVLKRRNMVANVADRNLLKEVYQLTAAERQAAGVKKGELHISK